MIPLFFSVFEHVITSKNGFIIDDNNLCIFGVFGWDFNLITSKVFVACVRHLNTKYVFI